MYGSAKFFLDSLEFTFEAQSLGISIDDRIYILGEWLYSWIFWQWRGIWRWWWWWWRWPRVLRGR